VKIGLIALNMLKGAADKRGKHKHNEYDGCAKELEAGLRCRCRSACQRREGERRRPDLPASTRTFFRLERCGRCLGRTLENPARSSTQAQV